MLAISIFFFSSAFSQGTTTVTGTVKNSKTQEFIPAVSVIIKDASEGAYTDDKGNFKFTTSKKPPFILVISSVSFATKEVEYSGQTVNVELEETFALGQEIVVAALRIPGRILEAPVTIERVNSTAIRNAPGASYYDALSHLKGVDITTSSYTFKTVSTRGFNGSGNLRFNQMVDGMDNTVPALNFSLSNVIGLTELDVDNMELLSGASSALYGSGGMNGTLLISSKDPFKYQGISFQIKQGIMHIDDYRRSASPFYDWSLRWGKKVSDKFAFKIGAEYTKADDWRADDTSDLLRTNVLSHVKTGANTTRATDPNYDGVNVYGDEASAGMKSFAQAVVATTVPTLPPGTTDLLNYYLAQGYTYPQMKEILGADPSTQPLLSFLPYYYGYVGPAYGRDDVYGSTAVSRTGYYEKDIVNYDAKNLKFSGGLYYNITSRTQVSLTGNWGYGTSVYTGADRYSLKNFRIGQYKLEFKSKNWFLRAYTTQENSGDSYASTLAALGINNAWKSNQDWFAQYMFVYSDAALSGVPASNANTAARAYADAGRFLPGTKDFNDAFNKSVKTPISKGAINLGGSQFADKSSLYQFEGQLNLSDYTKVIDVLIGATYRWYNLNSNGTIFADDPDSLGNIKIDEYGGYLQLKKALLNDVLTLTASGRYDKSENFKGRFTPRVTASIKVAKDNNIRFSYQQAYRFPNNQDQWINLRTPGSILIGCLQGFNDYYKFSTVNPVFTAESVVTYRDSFAVYGVPNPALLKPAEFKKAVPETMESFEIGYRGILGRKLLIDAYYYFSKYKKFIGREAVAGAEAWDLASTYQQLLSPFTSTNYSFVKNSPTPVKAHGWAISGEYQMQKGYMLTANVYSDQLKDVPERLVTFFNTPKYRFNIGLANPNAYKGFGFNVIYKWQDKINWEGTFGAGEVPSFGTVDAAISYKIGKTNNLVKLGANNLFNNYYRNAFGNPYVGGLYYISFGYNVF